MDNSEYQHPEWQKKRLEVMQAAEFKCQCCGNHDEQLNVHHVNYEHGRKIWEYSNKDLRCLCNSCHETFHSILKTTGNILSWCDKNTLDRFEHLMESMNCIIPPGMNRVFSVLGYTAGTLLEYQNMTEEASQEEKR